MHRFSARRFMAVESEQSVKTNEEMDEEEEDEFNTLA